MQGNLYFVDRKTDSLRRRGDNISSWEVEREINAHPAVLESAVFGVPSELGEDDVMAVIVLQPGQSLDAPALIAHCEERMARFMVPALRGVPRRASQDRDPSRPEERAQARGHVGERTWDRETA